MSDSTTSAVESQDSSAFAPLSSNPRETLVNPLPYEEMENEFEDLDNFSLVEEIVDAASEQVSFFFWGG